VIGAYGHYIIGCVHLKGCEKAVVKPSWSSFTGGGGKQDFSI